MCVPRIPPDCHGVSHYENLTPFCFSWFFLSPKKLWSNRAMANRDGNTNTGGGGNGKSVGWCGWTICEWEVSVHGWKMCEWEHLRWETWCDTDKSEPLRGVKKWKVAILLRDFVDVVKRTKNYVKTILKRTKNYTLEFLIGWRDFPDPIHDTWETLNHCGQGSEPEIREFNWSRDKLSRLRNSSDVWDSDGVQTDFREKLLETTMIFLMMVFTVYYNG